MAKNVVPSPTKNHFCPTQHKGCGVQVVYGNPRVSRAQNHHYLSTKLLMQVLRKSDSEPEEEFQQESYRFLLLYIQGSGTEATDSL